MEDKVDLLFTDLIKVIGKLEESMEEHVSISERLDDIKSLLKDLAETTAKSSADINASLKIIADTIGAFRDEE